MTGMDIGDWITIVAGVFGAIWGLRLINAKYYDEIMDVWAAKWNKETPENEKNRLKRRSFFYDELFTIYQ